MYVLRSALLSHDQQKFKYSIIIICIILATRFGLEYSEYKNKKLFVLVFFLRSFNLNNQYLQMMGRESVKMGILLKSMR